MRIQVGDVRLFVEVAGFEWVPDGDSMRRQPTVVVLHGGPGMDCTGVKGRLGFLEEKAQVVYYDHRGNGRSDRGDPSSWTLAQWGDDVKDLCDSLGIERPIVLGESFGGMVAMSYGTRHPSHPAALGLLVTDARQTSSDEVVEAFRALGGDDVAELVRADYEHSTPETSQRFIDEALPFMSRHPDAIALAQREVARMVGNQDVEIHFFNGEFNTMDFRGALAKVVCPTLVVSGEMDPMCPPSSFRELVAALPEDLVEGHLINGAGHFASLDAPQEFERIVTDFVLHHAPSSGVDGVIATP